MCCWWSSQLDSAVHLFSHPWKAAPAWYLLDAARQIKNYLLCLFVWNPEAGVEIFLVPHWVAPAFLGHLSIVCTASIKYSSWKCHAIFRRSCSVCIVFCCWLTSVWELALTCGYTRMQRKRTAFSGDEISFSKALVSFCKSIGKGFLFWRSWRSKGCFLLSVSRRCRGDFPCGHSPVDKPFSTQWPDPWSSKVQNETSHCFFLSFFLSFCLLPLCFLFQFLCFVV